MNKYIKYEVQLWFFHTALCIIASNTNAKFQVNQTGQSYAPD